MNTCYRKYAKRILDCLSALLLLLALAPLFALIAALIKFTSQGPVFYMQERVGRHGRPFTFVKFRTMVVNADKMGAGVLCLKDDPRVAPVGKVLRSYSLDELPQLWNVLKGDMSLIGPRPGLEYQVRKYTDFQPRRLEVLPGITGWAQINGRNSISWDERIRLDVEYVDNVSFWMDLKILLKTVKTVLLKENLIAARDYFREKAEKA